MKVAFNKEMLIKHRFWVILSPVIPFTGIAVILLTTTILSANLEKKKFLEDKLGESKNKVALLNAAKTPKLIADLKKQVDELNGKTNEVWAAAYEAQEHIYTWPDEMENLYEFTYEAKPRGRQEPKGLFAEAIRIHSDKKEPPKEDDPVRNIVTGKIIDHQRDFFYLEDRKGKRYKIYETAGMRIFHAGKEKDKNTLPFKNKEMANYMVSVFYQKGKYFGDPLTPRELIAYKDYYKSQIYPIIEMVQPIDANGQGRVRLGTWTYAPKTDPPSGTFFHYFTSKWDPDTNFSDDVWIAQENLWVQREIYSLIKEANDSVARFKLQPEKVAKGKVPQNYVLTNPYWEIKLTVKDEDSLVCTLKNLLPRGQKFNFDLKITTKANPKEPLLIRPPNAIPAFNPNGYSLKEGTVPAGGEGEYILENVAFSTGEDGKKPIVDLTKWEILAVEQDLNWETAAVRRIDGIYFSAVTSFVAESNRQFPEPLKPYDRVLAGGGPVAGAAAPPAPSADSKGKDKKAGPVAPGLGAGAGAGASAYGNDQTKTAFAQQIKERYIASEYTRQLRKLPVAVILTVEQAQIDRIQTAFNNSKLRFLTSQIMLTHTTDSLRPAVSIKEPVKEPGKEPVKDPFKAPPLRDPSKTGQPGGAAKGGNELEANMELIIYGTITIYDRFPARASFPAEWK